MNKIILSGRLTRNPEFKKNGDGSTLCEFGMAVDRSHNREKTDFIEVQAWGKLAEFICKYFAKGKAIELCGELQSTKWVDRDGNNRVRHYVNASEASFWGKKDDGVAAPVGVLPDDTPLPY